MHKSGDSLDPKFSTGRTPLLSDNELNELENGFAIS